MVRKHIRDIGSGCEHVLFQYPCGQNGWRIHSRRGRFTYRVPKPLHGICTHVLCWTIIGLPKIEQTQFFVMVKKTTCCLHDEFALADINSRPTVSGDGNSTQGFQFGSKGQLQDLSETSTTSIPHHESVCFLGGSESMGFIPILESPFWEHIFGTLSKDLMLIWDHHGSLDNKPLSHSFEYLLEEGRLSAWRIL